MDGSLRFTPSRVEGLADVEAVTVFSDRIELSSSTGVVAHRFAEIARWPYPRWVWKLLQQLRLRPRRLPVADRDWFHASADMYFEFYTTPRVKLFMPVDERTDDYASAYFVRIQVVIAQGGFNTVDLG